MPDKGQVTPKVTEKQVEAPPAESEEVAADSEAAQKETPSETPPAEETPTEPPAPETITVKEAARRREQALADQRAALEQDMDAWRQSLLARLPDEEAVALAETKIKAALIMDTRKEFPAFEPADLAAADWESEEKFTAAARRSHETRAAARQAETGRLEALVQERVAQQVAQIRADLGLPAAAPAGAPALGAPPTGEASFQGLTITQVTAKADADPNWFRQNFDTIVKALAGAK